MKGERHRHGSHGKARIFGVAVLFLTITALFADTALATATVTPATGGEAISADTVGGAYTALTGPVITEGVTADIGLGTVILNVPSGFEFDIGAPAPTVLVTRTGGAGDDKNNINDAPSGTSLSVTSNTATQITFTVDKISQNGVTNSLTWQNVRVRPTAASPLASGDITKTGTSVIAGVTGSTNFGTLTEVASGGGGETTPPPATDGGGGRPQPLDTLVFLSGMAYPRGGIGVFKKSVTEDAYIIDPTISHTITEDGYFEVREDGVIGDEYVYAVQLQDIDGRATSLFFRVDLTEQSHYVVTGILAPPTVEIKKTVLSRTDDLEIIGYAGIETLIEAEVDGAIQGETARSDKNGFYSLRIPMAPFPVGTHYIKVRQKDGAGIASDFSTTHAIRKSLLIAPQADFNDDGSVDIADWSIFLFHWGLDDENERLVIDLDQNGIIDIFDFSIFLKTIEI